MTKSRASRRPRRLRARPLLVAAGAVLAIASGGCGDGAPSCQTQGVCATQDLAVQVADMGIRVVPDMRSRGD